MANWHIFGKCFIEKFSHNDFGWFAIKIFDILSMAAILSLSWFSSDSRVF
jgi:hypothetical protein